MSGTYKGQHRLRYSGDKVKCRGLITEGRRCIQRMMDTNDDDLDITSRTEYLSDGSVLTSIKRFDDTLLEIFVPIGGKKKKTAYFQCDLYQDDPEFPKDVAKQIKSSIAFDVFTGGWFTIPERQGNVENACTNGLVSWDGLQTWGCSQILGYRAWNDAIYADQAADTCGIKYYPRPEVPARRGETVCRVWNYDGLEDLIDLGKSVLQLQALEFEAQIENGEEEEYNKEHLYKTHIYVDGEKISGFTIYDNKLVMGGGVHVTEEGIRWLIVILQPFRVEPQASVGVTNDYEEIHALELDNPDAEPFLVDTIDHQPTVSNPVIYATSKSYLTSWRFNAEGTKAVAFRDEQLGDATHWLFLSVGAWVEPRFINIEFTFSRNKTVTADITYDTSMTETTLQKSNDGTTMSGTERDAANARIIQWYADLYTHLGLPTDKNMALIDLDSDGENYFAFAVANRIYKQTVSQSDLATKAYYQLTADVVKSRRDCAEDDECTLGALMLEYETAHTRDLAYHKDWSTESEEWIYSTLNWIDTTGRSEEITVENIDVEELIGKITHFYIGGSPKHGIYFYIERRVERYQSFIQNELVAANTKNVQKGSAKTVYVTLKCSFKGTVTELGSTISHNIPPLEDTDEECNTDPIYDWVGEDLGTDALKALQTSTTEYGERYFRTTSGAYCYERINGPGGNSMVHTDLTHGVIAGQFRGSIKINIEGTAAVISCSYLDLAKFFHSWHRFEFDNFGLTYPNCAPKYDTMTKIGIDTETQDAYSKHMLNYAIIEGNNEDGTGFVDPRTTELSSYVSGGEASAGDQVEQKNLRIVQLSNLLFGTEVETEPDINGEYAYGIKEKDTTAFLPIGIYA